MISQAELKKLFHYSKSTGIFTRISTGKYSKTTSKDKYIYIFIGSRHYYAHRLAHLYVNGLFPKDQIDHIDGNKSNNKWNNLRAADKSQNLRNQGKYSNNSSGHKGVFWHKQNKNWTVRVNIDRKEAEIMGIKGTCKHIGSFNNKDDAVAASKLAFLKYHGEFANYG